MAVVRGNTGDDIYSKIFTKDKHDIPKAPSIGLYLENVFFEYYNKKFGRDGMHEAVEWTKCEHQVKKFKEEQIMCKLIEDMLKENIFEEYLPILDLHSYTTEIGHRLNRQVFAREAEQAKDGPKSVNGDVKDIDTEINSKDQEIKSECSSF